VRFMHVCKGHIIPIVDRENRSIDCSVLDGRDYEEYRIFLMKLREFLEDYKTFLDNVKVSGDDLLEAIADAIVAFFKAPLIIEPFPIAVIPTPYRIYWLWVLGRWKSEFKAIFKASLEEDPEILLDFFVRVLRGKSGIDPSLAKCIKTILVEENKGKEVGIHKVVWNVFLKIPADTRPGANTSSLLVHLLTVSAIASQRVEDRHKKQILRLAGLLHDIGKPLAWVTNRPHIEVSLKWAEKILGEILPKDSLNEVLKEIKRHHEEGSILKIADIEASAIDRVSDIVAKPVSKVIGKDLEETKRLLETSGPEAWFFWKNLSLETIYKATIEAVKALRKYIPKYSGEWFEEAGFNVLLLDVKGIQGFISRTSEIKSLIAGSYLIDLLTLYAIPRALNEALKLPPEAIGYAGGGIVKAIVSKNMKADIGDDLKDAVKKIVGEKLSGGLDFYVLEASGYRIWPYTGFVLARKKAREKILLKQGVTVLERLGFERICEECGERPATIKNEDEYVCMYCNARLKAGLKLSVLSKLKRSSEEILQKKENVKMPISAVRKYLMEFLAGHSLKEVKNGSFKRILNLAILKADGNMMGVFMANSVSITEEVEKSYRIDRALKEGYRRIYYILKELSEEDEGAKYDLIRLIAGLLYSGGDDTLAILPSWLAIPVALILIDTFKRELGNSNYSPTLSVGIVSSHAKYNIWGVLESVESLLNLSKTRFRSELISGKAGDTRGFLAFFFVERGIITGEIVSSILSSYGKKSLSLQPYSFNELLNILRKILGFTGSLSDLLKLSYSIFSKVSANEKDDVSERIKKLRGIIREVYAQGLYFSEDSKDKIDMAHKRALVYIVKEEAKHEGTLREAEEEVVKRSKLFGILRELSDVNNLKCPPLLDLYLIIKFLGGGAL